MRNLRKLISLLLAVLLILPVGTLSFTATASSDSIKVGDTLTLGTYLDEPIVWRCVSIDKNGPLMLSDNILCFKSFDAKGNYGNYYRNKEGTNNWKDSALRHWLNSSGTVDWSNRISVPSKNNVFNGYNPYNEELGFLTGFSEQELSIIKTVTQKSYINALDKGRSDGGSTEITHYDGSLSELYRVTNNLANCYYQNTQDSIFLLGIEQLEAAYKNMGTEYFKCKPTAAAVKNDTTGFTDKDTTCNWWLRTPATCGMSYENVKVICGDTQYGTLSAYSVWNGSNYHSAGVRPAFYLDLEKYEYNIKGNGLKLYSTHSSNYLSVGDTVDVIVGNYKDNALDTSTQDFITVISDSDVIDITKGDWNKDKGRCYSITAKKQGTATITFSVPGSNKSTAFTFYVENKETAYTFYNLPQLEYEKGKTTHFYNYGGLVVNDFKYSAHKTGNEIDYYYVTMTIYNACNLYGAVTSFDRNGDIYEYKIIDKMSDFESSFTSSVKTLFYETGDLYYLLCNESYYSGKSITKKNEIEIRVPVGGYIQISNNISDSEVALVANSIYGIYGIMSVSNEYLDMFDSDSFNEATTKKIVNTVTGKIIDKTIEKSIKKAAITTVQNVKMNYNNIDEFFIELGNKSDEFLHFNLVEEIEKNICSVSGIAKITESYITALLPTGGIIKILYASNKALDYALFNNEFSLSSNKPTGINIYAPTNSNSYVSSGIKVSPVEGDIQTNTTTHSYVVEDIDLSKIQNSSWIDSNDYMHYKQQMYNITMYKNGNESQPDSTVKVKIPLPDGFRTNAIKVYRYYDDGMLLDMNGYVENGYVIFETDHFSYYLVLDTSIEHTDTDNDGTCDICGKDMTENCKCICHSKNIFVQFVWEILCAVFRFLNIDAGRYCDCGVAHW